MISGRVLIILDGTIMALIIGVLETDGGGTTASTMALITVLIMVGVGIMVLIMVGDGITDLIIGDTILFGTHIKII
jgi:hypothetical protein